MNAVRIVGPSRVRGRGVVIGHTRRALLACHRFACHRARTPDDLAWSARVLDALTAALAVADPAGAPRAGGGRHP